MGTGDVSNLHYTAGFEAPSPAWLVEISAIYLCSDPVSGSDGAGVVGGTVDGAGVVVGAGGVGSDGLSSVVGLDGGVAGAAGDAFSSFDESQAARPKVAASSTA